MKLLAKILFVSLVFNSINVFSQTTNYKVYALFVFSIVKYISWPVENPELHILVVGKSKVYDELLKAAAEKKVNGLSIKVSQSETVPDADHVDIIYLSDGKSGMLHDILKTINGKSVMVIAEREGLFKKGAGVSFVLMDNNTLRFDINHSDLEKRQIKVSKSLTTLANSTI